MTGCDFACSFFPNIEAIISEIKYKQGGHSARISFLKTLAFIELYGRVICTILLPEKFIEISYHSAPPPLLSLLSLLSKILSVIRILKINHYKKLEFC